MESIKPDSREFENARGELFGAKRAMLAGKFGCYTYKGWKVMLTNDDVDKVDK